MIFCAHGHRLWSGSAAISRIFSSFPGDRTWHLLLCEVSVSSRKFPYTPSSHTSHERNYQPVNVFCFLRPPQQQLSELQIFVSYINAETYRKLSKRSVQPHKYGTFAFLFLFMQPLKTEMRVAGEQGILLYGIPITHGHRFKYVKCALTVNSVRSAPEGKRRAILHLRKVGVNV